MKINKLLIAAVLAIAIGAPIAGFCGDMNGAADDVHRGTGSVPSRIPNGQAPVKPSWLPSSTRTNGSIRRR